jgi:hypothetical protein
MVNIDGGHRIDIAQNTVNHQEAQKTGVAHVADTQEAETGKKVDSVQLTEQAVMVQKVEELVTQMPVVDPKKVEAAKLKYKSMSDINPEQLAEKMLAQEREIQSVLAQGESKSRKTDGAMGERMAQVERREARSESFKNAYAETKPQSASEATKVQTSELDATLAERQKASAIKDQRETD